MAESFPFPYAQIDISIGALKIRVAAIIDTGHSGGLIVPASEREKLGDRTGLAHIRLADESELDLEFFYATITLAHREIVVSTVCMGSEFVIEQEVIRPFRVCFDRGQKVEIED